MVRIPKILNKYKKRRKQQLNWKLLRVQHQTMQCNEMAEIHCRSDVGTFEEGIRLLYRTRISVRVCREQLKLLI